MAKYKKRNSRDSGGSSGNKQSVVGGYLVVKGVE